MKEISIHLRPLPSSPWITHDPACRTSIVSIDSTPQPLSIEGVRLDGLPLRFRVLDALTVIVSPQSPLEGGRLEIRCTVPAEPGEGVKTKRATYPSPPPFYGLTAPEYRHQGQDQ